jgi:hypothetical protein
MSSEHLPTIRSSRRGEYGCVVEAPDEAAARAYMEQDPTIFSGIARGELREFRASSLRGRT